MKRITREFLREQRCCYTDEQVAELVPARGLTLAKILALDVPVADRIWVATLPGACPPTVLWAWQALLVERALGRVARPDPRSLAVVTLLRRLAGEEDVPQSERDAAVDAARAAVDAARAAARASVDAARAAVDAARAAVDAARAAGDAAWAAARASEDSQQVVDLVRLLAEMGTP